MRVQKGPFLYTLARWIIINGGVLAMAGTIQGGRKAAATNKSKYGKDFYARIGKMGGKLGRTGGFYANRDLAREAGRRGGRISRRGPAKSA
jgi:general stress protein YciG